MKEGNTGIAVNIRANSDYSKSMTRDRGTGNTQDGVPPREKTSGVFEGRGGGAINFGGRWRVRV
jgi:hypothetical protein